MVIPEASARKVAVVLNSFGLYDRVGLGPGMDIHMHNCNRYFVIGEGFGKKIWKEKWYKWTQIFHSIPELEQSKCVFPKLSLIQIWMRIYKLTYNYYSTI